MTPLADSLTRLSARRITRDLEALREERRRIEEQEELLQELLRLKEEYSRNGASPETPKKRRPNKREAILSILHAEPGRTWAPREIRAALAAKGIDTAAKSLGVMLLRMVESGQLARGDRGEYKLASNADLANEEPNLGQLTVPEPTPSRSLGDPDA